MNQFGPEANAPPAFGAIAALENAIGAPLSDGAKQLVEQVSIQAFNFGVQLASEMLSTGQEMSARSSQHGESLARKSAKIAANVANGKFVEASLSEPASA